MAFIFGGNTPWSYDDLKKKREIAEALALANTQAPQNVGEGLNAIGRALAYRGITKRAGKEEARMREEFNRKWGSVFSGQGGGSAYAGGGSPSGTWTPAPPGPKATETFMGMPDVAKGGLSFGDKPKAGVGVAGGEKLDFGAAVMTPQEMLIEGATRRGLDPIDVATAISYETGGKFDPTIKGPTTQWGTHEGLIQFGDPQGEKYGADFSSADAAWRSQLNPDSGAVWKYLEDTGVKPGMGLPEVYSAINAGSVGRMNASDANNGGAPGTVADKVAGMAPHRANAAKFLGGTWTPTEGDPVVASAMNGGQGGVAPQMGMDIGSLVALASDPMASPQQQAVVNALIQQQMQMMDPVYQMEREKAALELAQMKNPQPGFKTLTDDEERQMGLDPSGIYQTDGSGKIVVTQAPKELAKPPASVSEYQFYVEEATRAGKTPMSYEEFLVADEKAGVPPGSPQVGTIPQGYQLVQGADGAYSMQPIPGGPEDNSVKDAKKEGNAETAASVVTTAAERALAASKDRALGGLGQGLVANLPWTDSAEVARQVDVLKANAKVDNLQAMRDASPTGGALGSVTEGETAMLAAKSGALDPSSPNFERDLADYTRTLLRVVHGPEEGDRIFAGTWKGAMPEGQTQPQGTSEPANITNDAEYDALPSGAVYIGPDGVKRRKP